MDEELGRRATVFVASFAVVFLVSSVALVLKGTPFTYFFPLFPYVGIRITSVLLYSTLFILVLARRFPTKAVFVLGLMWGAAELVNNGELLFLEPWYVTAQVPHAYWWAYEAGVAALAGVSLFVLRHQLKARRGLLCLAAILCYTPLALHFGAPVPDIVTLQVLEIEVPWHLLIIASVLLTVKKDP